MTNSIDRVTVTLPRELLAQANARARQLDRSRSWVVAEALRTYLAAPVVREPGVAYAGREVAAARRLHLATELRLTLAERLRRAEELGRLGRAAQRRRPRQQIIGFDTYEDYYEWKRKAHLVGV